MVTMRAVEVLTTGRRFRAAELRAQGTPVAQIAKELGVDRAWAYKLIQQGTALRSTDGREIAETLRFLADFERENATWEPTFAAVLAAERVADARAVLEVRMEMAGLRPPARARVIPIGTLDEINRAVLRLLPKVT